MSDSEAQPVSLSTSRAAETSSRTPVSAGGAARPLLHFFADWLLAMFAMFAMLVATGFIWAVLRGIQIGVQDGFADMDASSLVHAVGNPSSAATIVMVLISTGGAALLVYFLRRRATAAERATSRQAALSRSTWVKAALVGLGIFLVSTLATRLAQSFGVAPNPSNLGLIKDVFSTHPVFLSLFAVVLAPAYEELLFRRVLFGRLWAAGRPWLGAVLSSLAFALAHELPGANGNEPPATLLLWAIYASMGMAFAWLYRRTGTLWAPIGAHMLNNALALSLFGLAGG
jgi:membrane protease YdiL (CAAX protease family)